MSGPSFPNVQKCWFRNFKTPKVSNNKYFTYSSFQNFRILYFEIPKFQSSTCSISNKLLRSRVENINFKNIENVGTHTLSRNFKILDPQSCNNHMLKIVWAVFVYLLKYFCNVLSNFEMCQKGQLHIGISF